MPTLTTDAKAKEAPPVTPGDGTSPPPNKKSKVATGADAEKTAALPFVPPPKDQKADANKTAARPFVPPPKDQNTLTHMFKKKAESNDKAIEFVKEHAPVTTPTGYARIMTEIEGLRLDMHAAADRDDFEVAGEKKAAIEELLPDTLLQRRLHDNCLMAKRVSEEKIAIHKAKQNYRKCQEYKDVLTIAEAYLEAVAPEDVEQMMLDMGKGKSNLAMQKDSVEVDLTKDSDAGTAATARDWESDSESESDWDTNCASDVEEMLEDEEFMGNKDVILAVEEGEIEDMVEAAMEQLEDALGDDLTEADVAKLREQIEEIVETAGQFGGGGKQCYDVIALISADANVCSRHSLIRTQASDEA